jgi:hypothetical protein
VGLRRHRHQAADVRIKVEVARELLGRDPGLRLLAREVDLDQSRDLEPLRRRLGRERVAQLADRVHGLRLAALEVADEVPAESVAVAGVLHLQVLGPVLADDLDARLGQDRQLVEREVLRRGDHGHSGRARLLVALADALRRQRRSRPGGP